MRTLLLVALVLTIAHCVWMLPYDRTHHELAIPGQRGFGIVMLAFSPVGEGWISSLI